jgi:heptosyltransferase-2
MNMFTKILIVGPAWIGDMVMAQTLFKLLKQRQPNAIIHVLAPKWTSPLLERMPEVDRVLISPFGHQELNLYKRYIFGKSLRNENYHQAIILPNSFKSALIPFWARIPRRIGWRGEMRYWLINDMRVLNKSKLPLMIERFASLGLNHNESLPDHLPWPELQAQPSSKNVNQPVLVICPGAEYGPTKQWPADYFAEVAKSKLAAGWQVWIFGGQKDQFIANKIQQLTDNACTDFTGKTSLQEAIDLMPLANVVVSNDTGLMHIAASLHRPLVVIYGSSSPQFTLPLAKNAQIVSLNLSCSPCFKRLCPLKHINCLMNLTPEIVLEALGVVA